MRVLVVLAAQLLLLACSTLSVAPPEDSGGVYGKAETWADYSMMRKPWTGQLWANGKVVSQYQWVPVDNNESHVYWGLPDKWPPDYRERFIRNGAWVMLDGWWGNGTYYSLRVTNETLCDAKCSNCTTIAQSGPQHYTRWIVPVKGYCMRADGVLTEQSSGKQLLFRHDQKYSPPAPCSNSTLVDQVCIEHWESWSDNRDSPLKQKLERVTYFAKGLGGGFKVIQSFPTPWQAEFRKYK